MATERSISPAPGASRSSRIGSMDPMDLTRRVYVDATLREVAPDDPNVAFVYKRSDLERVRARRAELGLDTNDEAARTQMDSRRQEIPKVEAQIAELEAQLAVLRAGQPAAADADAGAEAKATPRSKKAGA